MGKAIFFQATLQHIKKCYVGLYKQEDKEKPTWKSI